MVHSAQEARTHVQAGIASRKQGKRHFCEISFHKIGGVLHTCVTRNIPRGSMQGAATWFIPTLDRVNSRLK